MRESIVLDESLSDLQITPIRDVSDSISLSGRYSKVTLRPSIKVRITLERFTDRHLFRKFSAMINHLERGGWVAFGNDDAKVWGATLMMKTFQGGRTFTCGDNLYSTYAAGSSSLVNLVGTTVAPYGDEIVVESHPPEAKREYFTLLDVTVGSSGLNALSVDTFSPTRSLDHSREDYETGTLVRHADFYPKLFLPGGAIGGALLTHEHRIAYTLDIELEYVIPMKTAQSLDVPENNDPVLQPTNGDGTGDPQDSAASSPGDGLDTLVYMGPGGTGAVTDPFWWDK
tara:strand:- start:689 stop:1543 length:855 start_codon:yes stop_codon:yes gene_type:complete